MTSGVDLFAPMGIVTLGFGPSMPAGSMITGGTVSSLQSIADALAFFGTGLTPPPVTIGGSSESSALLYNRYDISDKTDRFTIKVGLVRLNDKVWGEDKKVTYVTEDDITIVKMELVNVRVASEDIFIKAAVKAA
jgi:hypothetical protein